jgi:hypothetical protein
MSDVAATNCAVITDANGMYYRDLNAKIRELANNGIEHIELRSVFGQRYIGTNLSKSITIDIYGTPGNDLGAFMNGSRITVFGNAQDGCGNKLNSGEIIFHGHAGDVIGLGRHLADELGAHVLEGILEFDVASDGHPIVRDRRGPVLLVEHDIAALGPERDSDGAGKAVDTVPQ